MQIKETIGVPFPGSDESPPLEDVVVLVDSAGVALGVQRAFSARVRGVLLPRVHAAGLPSNIVGTDIAYTPSPDGGVLHVVHQATAAPTS